MIVSFNKYLLGLVIITLMFSCKKNENEALHSPDKATLNYLVKDNFTLGLFAVALNRTGLDKQLDSHGPYTLLAPSDDAFKAAGFSSQAAVFAAPVAELSLRSMYHILPGEQSIAKQPLGLNQVLKAASGKGVYLSRIKKGQDTITTINGARVLKSDTRASNGLLQVIDRLLVPNVFDKVGDALSADIDLVLFYQALRRSGLLTELNGEGNYTIYALDNAAMRSSGYTNIMDIEAADPAQLKTWLSYYIARERRFAQDYFLLTAAGETYYTETMLDNRTITVNLRNSMNVPNGFSGISVKGPGNNWGITPTRTDILAGNGVIHVLAEVLR